MDGDQKKNAIQHLIHCIGVMSGKPTRQNHQHQLNDHRNSLSCESQLKWNGRKFMQVKDDKVDEIFLLYFCIFY